MKNKMNVFLLVLVFMFMGVVSTASASTGPVGSTGSDVSANTTADADEEMFMCKKSYLSSILNGYKYVDFSEGSYAVFVDPKTTKVNKTELHTWVTYVAFRENEQAYTDNEGIIIMYIKFNKDGSKFMILSAQGYQCGGRPGVKYQLPKKWEYTIPGSVTASVYKTLRNK